MCQKLPNSYIFQLVALTELFSTVCQSGRRVTRNLNAHDLPQRTSSSQDLLTLYTQVTKNCFSSFGYWLRNVDSSLRPGKQIRIYAVEAYGFSTFKEISNSAISWLGSDNSFLANSG